MKEPRWLSRQEVQALHSMVLAATGGADGVRDEGLLESALGRPVNKFAYGEASIPVLGAAYAYGIARNHPFVDGNKRTAFMAMALFVEDNGLKFTATEEEATLTFLALAAGDLSEESLAAWIADNSAYTKGR